MSHSKEDKELFEKLAHHEHARWADWQKYMFSLCRRQVIQSYNYKTKQHEDIETGNLVIPKEMVEHWTRQINTEYKDLTELEKESDREQVLRYWKLIK